MAGAEEGVNLHGTYRCWRRYAEIGGKVLFPCLAPHCEHVMSEMETVILRPAVRPQEDLEGMPRGLDGVGVVTRI